MAKSQFTKALGRELGKSTGRRIANGLFGDKHASKSVHIIQGRLQTQKAKSDVEKAKIEAELEIEESKMEQENKAIEDAQVSKLSSFTLSSNEHELANQLNQIITLISGQKSKRIKKAGIEKIEFGIMRLKEPEQKDFFQKKIKKIKLIYFLPYYIWGIVIILFILFYWFLFNFIF